MKMMDLGLRTVTMTTMMANSEAIFCLYKTLGLSG